MLSLKRHWYFIFSIANLFLIWCPVERFYWFASQIRCVILTVAFRQAFCLDEKIQIFFCIFNYKNWIFFIHKIINIQIRGVTTHIVIHMHWAPQLYFLFTVVTKFNEKKTIKRMYLTLYETIIFFSLIKKFQNRFNSKHSERLRSREKLLRYFVIDRINV